MKDVRVTHRLTDAGLPVADEHGSGNSRASSRRPARRHRRRNRY